MDPPLVCPIEMMLKICDTGIVLSLFRLGLGVGTLIWMIGHTNNRLYWRGILWDGDRCLGKIKGQYNFIITSTLINIWISNFIINII